MPGVKHHFAKGIRVIHKEYKLEDKFKYYLDGLFATAPVIDGIADIKQKLYDRMKEQYQAYLQQGLDQQTAYDRVIESIGDIGKAVSHLREGQDKETKNNKKFQWKPSPDSTKKIAEMAQNFSDVVSGFMLSIFNRNDPRDISLVNKISIPVNDAEKIRINYLSESVILKQSLDGNILVREYMNSDDPVLFAEVRYNEDEIQIRHGRRKGLHLKSRIEVYIPADWKGTLAVSNISFDISSVCDWHLSGFIAKSVGGSIEIKSITADSINLFSSVGSLNVPYCSGKMDLNTSNGDIHVQEAIGHGSFSSLSGNIKVNLRKPDGKVRLSSETGEIHLYLSGDESLDLTAASVTGGIFSPFRDPGGHPFRNQVHTVQGEFPYQTVEISTTTGNIFIEEDKASHDPEVA
jgi:DUF4097 and DUF4098 domain-containing protein YvlB